MTAVVLFSGGLDSTVLLALAVEERQRVYALSFNYGQKNLIELEAAKAIAKHYEVPHIILDLPCIHYSGCSLTSEQSLVPKDRSMKEIQDENIPSTYVPARNTLFLSYAMQQAEIVEANYLYFGANAQDFYNYPDCRPDFFESFQVLLDLSTRQGLEGRGPKLITPFLKWDKDTIICQGDALRAPLEKTWSCYEPTKGLHCGCCDACLFRQRGFIAADVEDKTPYANKVPSFLEKG